MLLPLPVKPCLGAVVLALVAGAVATGAGNLGGLMAVMAGQQQIAILALPATGHGVEGGSLVIAKGVTIAGKKAIPVVVDQGLQSHLNPPTTAATWPSGH